MTVGAEVRDLSGIPKGLSGWQKAYPEPRRHSSEGSPAWMQVVEPCLERRPRNPVVYTIHSRKAGMTTEALFRQAGRNRNRPDIPASPPSAACSRRRSTTYIPVGVDPDLRRNDGGGYVRDFVRNIEEAIGVKKNPFQPQSSFQRRLESSGLDKSFPQSGNDSRGISQRTGRNHNPSHIPTSPFWIPAFAGMTAGLIDASRPAPNRQAGMTSNS